MGIKSIKDMKATRNSTKNVVQPEQIHEVLDNVSSIY